VGTHIALLWTLVGPTHRDRPTLRIREGGRAFARARYARIRLRAAVTRARHALTLTPDPFATDGRRNLQWTALMLGARRLFAVSIAVAVVALASLVRCGARTSVLGDTVAQDGAVEAEVPIEGTDSHAAHDAASERFSVCTSASAVAKTFGHPAVCCCIEAHGRIEGMNCTNPGPPDATAQREACLASGGNWYSYESD
jgi:hypothetical protein